jgi:hypothetical protein
MRDKIHVLLLFRSYENESLDSTDVMSSIFGSLSFKSSERQDVVEVQCPIETPYSSLHHLVCSLDKAEPRRTECDSNNATSNNLSQMHAAQGRGTNKNIISYLRATMLNNRFGKIQV